MAAPTPEEAVDRIIQWAYAVQMQQRRRADLTRPIPDRLTDGAMFVIAARKPHAPCGLAGTSPTTDPP